MHTYTLKLWLYIGEKKCSGVLNMLTLMHCVHHCRCSSSSLMGTQTVKIPPCLSQRWFPTLRPSTALLQITVKTSPALVTRLVSSPNFSSPLSSSLPPFVPPISPTNVSCSHFPLYIFIHHLKYFTNAQLTLFYNFSKWNTHLDGLHCHLLRYNLPDNL